MVRYFCNNCNDQLLKQILSVVDHIWGKHGIEVQKYPSGSSFRCVECDKYFKSIIPFLEHIDKNHGIHIWYEKGLTNKKLFLDGTLNKTFESNDMNGMDSKDNSGHNIPISKRPYKPRQKSEYSD
jgi:hypothetical protein